VRRSVAQAKNSFEKIQHLDERHKTDPYALLAVGNIYFSHLHRTDPGKYTTELGWAKNFYEGVLRTDPSNAFAANGMGMVLAEHGLVSQALDTFSRVKTIGGDLVPDATINLAHLLTLDGKYFEAVKNYSAVLRRHHHGNSAEILVFIAHAHFCDGDHRSALRALSRAVRASPADGCMWFNLASVQQDFAKATLDLLRQPERVTDTSVADLNAARQYLERADRLLLALETRLSRTAPPPAGEPGTAEEKDQALSRGAFQSSLEAMGVNSERVRDALESCRAALEVFPERLAFVEATAKERAEAEVKRQEAARAVAEAQEEVRRKRREEEEAQRLQRQEQFREKQRLLEEASAAQQQQAEQEAAEKRARKAGKKRSNAELDGFEEEPAMPPADVATRRFGLDSDEDGDEDEGPRGRPPPASTPSAAALGLEDSDEDEPPARRPAAALPSGADPLGLDSDEEDGDDEGLPTKGPRKRPSTAADLGLDSDEEDGAVEEKGRQAATDADEDTSKGVKRPEAGAMAVDQPPAKRAKTSLEDSGDMGE